MRGVFWGGGSPSTPFSCPNTPPCCHLALGVAVAVLVLVAQGELLGVTLLDLLVGHLLTDSLPWGGVLRGHMEGGLFGRTPCPPPPPCTPHQTLTASISLSAFHCS